VYRLSYHVLAVMISPLVGLPKAPSATQLRTILSHSLFVRLRWASYFGMSTLGQIGKTRYSRIPNPWPSLQKMKLSLDWLQSVRAHTYCFQNVVRACDLCAGRHLPGTFFTASKSTEKHSAVFGDCKELDCASDNCGVIPWTQIRGINSITDSIICVTAVIHRNIKVSGATPTNAVKAHHSGLEDQSDKQAQTPSGSRGGSTPPPTCISREVNVEIFILNCPAQKLIEIMFDHKRIADVRAAIADKYKQQRLENELSAPEEHTDGGTDIRNMNYEEVATVEWPPAVEAVSDLEHAIVAVEHELAHNDRDDGEVLEDWEETQRAVRPQTKSEAQVNTSRMFDSDDDDEAGNKHRELQRERTHLMVRLCRIWCYFMMALEIPHHRTLSEKEFERRRNADFAKLHVFGKSIQNASPGVRSSVELVPDVEISMYRIEFLLDRAELHIREVRPF
jgi:hypothetical protein